MTKASTSVCTEIDDGNEQHSATARPTTTELDGETNNTAFCDAVLALFDQWVADGVIKKS